MPIIKQVVHTLCKHTFAAAAMQTHGLKIKGHLPLLLLLLLLLVLRCCTAVRSHSTHLLHQQAPPPTEGGTSMPGCLLAGTGLPAACMPGVIQSPNHAARLWSKNNLQQLQF
jgi:hypothetical protein